MNVVILTLINKRTTNMLKEVSYKDLKFNPFRLIGDEWMLVTAGNEKDGCNTMTASWGGIGCLWGHNDPVATIYLRPSRYTKEFVDKEDHFTLCVMDKSFKKQMAYIGSVSGRQTSVSCSPTRRTQKRKTWRTLSSVARASGCVQTNVQGSCWIASNYWLHPSATSTILRLYLPSLHTAERTG